MVTRLVRQEALPRWLRAEASRQAAAITLEAQSRAAAAAIRFAETQIPFREGALRAAQAMLDATKGTVGAEKPRNASADQETTPEHWQGVVNRRRRGPGNMGEIIRVNASKQVALAIKESRQRSH